MEKQVIYGVFAIDIELPKKSNKQKELTDLATAMQSMSDTIQKRGRFVRAYSKLEDAVTDCYEENGCRLARILEVPDGVNNGKEQTLYYPMVIEVK